ncbi:MAG: hypothetical protein JRI23_16490 [Deltaproteobacteria bacterium]|jgi:hypothetical protein|nr:hypothetical protein [Deltaproteobacteria bacterium]MBW2533375.1 hypothetical protein [Deltaproteobacteria bacterium]
MKTNIVVRGLAFASVITLGCGAGTVDEGLGEDNLSRPPVRDSSGKADGMGASIAACLECIQYGGGAGCGPRCTFSQACSTAVAGGCASGQQTSLQQCLEACNPCDGSCGSGDYNSGAYTSCTCGTTDPCGWSNDGYCDSQCQTKFGFMFDDSQDCGGSSSSPPTPPDGSSSSGLDCGSDCGDGSFTSGAYTSCTCDTSDPCGWSNDGYCDSQCQTKFGSMFDDSQDCSSGSSGGSTGSGDYDSVLGNQFANAAQAGSAGYSMGRCYEYVWAALRSVLGWQIESLPIPPTSAYQFGEWVINNPQTARAELHLARTFTSAASAPRGSVIVWPRGVCGYSSTHGHIEISLGNGTACSDFCAPVASCTAQVFMPVH